MLFVVDLINVGFTEVVPTTMECPIALAFIVKQKKSFLYKLTSRCFCLSPQLQPRKTVVKICVCGVCGCGEVVSGLYIIDCMFFHDIDDCSACRLLHTV